MRRIQVRRQLGVARFDDGEKPRHSVVAALSTGTLVVQVLRHVGDAPGMAVLQLDAPSAAHPSVDGRRHQDDLACAATDVERLRDAVLFGGCRTRAKKSALAGWQNFTSF